MSLYDPVVKSTYGEISSSLAKTMLNHLVEAPLRKIDRSKLNNTDRIKLLELLERTTRLKLTLSVFTQYNAANATLVQNFTKEITENFKKVNYSGANQIDAALVAKHNYRIAVVRRDLIRNFMTTTALDELFRDKISHKKTPEKFNKLYASLEPKSLREIHKIHELLETDIKNTISESRSLITKISK